MRLETIVLAAAACCVCLHLSAASAKRNLQVIVDPAEQTSIDWDKHLKYQTPDIAFDEPPVARKVKDYEPEGIHLTPWEQVNGTWTILVSWQTGEGRVGKTKHPPKAHDPSKVPGVVKYGLASGDLIWSVVGDKDFVYKYVYGKDVGGRTYQSPVLHHVLLRGLTPGATYYYSVGSDKHGWSKELKLRVPPGTHQLPFRIGLIGDLGQTYNSSATLDHLRRHKPEMVWHVGDSTYADNYCSDTRQSRCRLSSDQRRWDTWARLTERVFSEAPMLHIHGNHDREMQTNNAYKTFEAINARYPLPTDPSVINTSPNYAASYLDLHGLKPERFINEWTAEPNNSYYAMELPGTYFIVMSTYVPYGRHSHQHRWLLEQFSKVDRDRTPWLVLMFHVAPRNNYVVHFKEIEEFMDLYEPLFYEHGVDLVYNGHVHAYERTLPMYKYKVDPYGPMYTCIGDGGNMEGLARWFVDERPPYFCDDPQSFLAPQYQPSPSGKPRLSFQDGRFCPESQPEWSAYRDPSFGHGMLTIHNATHAEWQWYRNQDGEAVVADHIFIQRSPQCSQQAPRAVFSAAPFVEGGDTTTAAYPADAFTFANQGRARGWEGVLRRGEGGAQQAAAAVMGPAACH